MKYCPKCGTQLIDDAAYCFSCGQSQDYTVPQRRTSAQPSDPSLTRNIALILASVLFALFTLIPAKNGRSEDVVIFIFGLCISALFAFFAIRPSDDHIDTDNMTLLKTVEAFSISVIYLIFCFTVDAVFILMYLAFVILFASLAAAKINKIDRFERNKTEKVLLAFSAVIIVFCSIEAFGCAIYLMICMMRG